jgi:transposase-like protein
MKQPNKFNSQLQQEILDSFQQLVKTLIKTLLEALMLEEREIYLEETEDYANGFYSRDLLTALGEVKGLRVPRVRKGSFRPVILPERRKAGLDLAEVVISLYASGVSTRKIFKVLENIYGAYYSPQSISRLIKVTEEEIKAWKERALSEEYFAVFLDGTLLSVRRNGVEKEPVYLALGIKFDGSREILGFWLFGSEGESAKNWEEILRELSRRGVKKVQLFITDDLPGIENAIKMVYPGSEWQLCVLHTVRNSLNKVRVKDRSLFAEDLKRIYRAETKEKAKEEILRLKERWGKIYPKVVKKWEDKAYALLTFLRYPKEIRQFIYTTNQLERLAKEIKRRIKVIEVFPDEGSVERLLYLLLKELNERLNSRKLRGFKEIESGNYHALPGEFFTQ